MLQQEPVPLHIPRQQQVPVEHLTQQPVPPAPAL